MIQFGQQIDNVSAQGSWHEKLFSGGRFYPHAPWPSGKRYMARGRVTAFTNFYKQQADRLAHGPAGGGGGGGIHTLTPRLGDMQDPTITGHEMNITQSDEYDQLE
jgi:hypothetical protein